MPIDFIFYHPQTQIIFTYKSIHVATYEPVKNIYLQNGTFFHKLFFQLYLEKNELQICFSTYYLNAQNLQNII